MTRVELLEKVGVWKHARSFAKAAGKEVYDYARTTKRDTRRMFRAHKALTRTRPIDITNLKNLQRGGTIGQRSWSYGQDVLKGPGAFTKSDWARKKRGFTAAETARQRMGNIRSKAVQRNAIRLGAVALGATAGSYAYRAYKLRKRQAKEKPQYRTYDVYPEHGHATAGYQQYNRPMYYDQNEIGSGPPRAEEWDRKSLINRIVEACAV